MGILGAVVFAFCRSGAVGIGGAERTGCGCMSPDCMRTGLSGVQTAQVVKSSVHGLDECRAEREKLRTVRGLGECRSVSSDSSYMLRMRDSLGDMHACITPSPVQSGGAVVCMTLVHTWCAVTREQE